MTPLSPKERAALQREAFVAGAKWATQGNEGIIPDEAARRYPMPLEAERVTLSDGSVWLYEPHEVIPGRRAGPWTKYHDMTGEPSADRSFNKMPYVSAAGFKAETFTPDDWKICAEAVARYHARERGET